MINEIAKLFFCLVQNGISLYFALTSIQVTFLVVAFGVPPFVASMFLRFLRKHR